MTTMHRTHECPWPGCTERVPRYLWGCKEHWKLLPRELRRRCNHAWRFGPAVEHMEALEAIDEWIAEHESGAATGGFRTGEQPGPDAGHGESPAEDVA